MSAFNSGIVSENRRCRYSEMEGNQNSDMHVALHAGCSIINAGVDFDFKDLNKLTRLKRFP